MNMFAYIFYVFPDLNPIFLSARTMFIQTLRTDSSCITFIRWPTRRNSTLTNTMNWRMNWLRFVHFLRCCSNEHLSVTVHFMASINYTGRKSKLILRVWVLGISNHEQSGNHMEHGGSSKIPSLGIPNYCTKLHGNPLNWDISDRASDVPIIWKWKSEKCLWLTRKFLKSYI